jgi:hypothetical protein
MDKEGTMCLYAENFIYDMEDLLLHLYFIGFLPSQPLSYILLIIDIENKTISVASVRKRTIPTERPQLVGEVSANFSG